MRIPGDWAGGPQAAGEYAVLDGATASYVADVLRVYESSARAQGRGLDPRHGPARAVCLLASERFEELLRFRKRNLGTFPAAEERIVGDMTTVDAARRLGITPRAVAKRWHAYGGRKVAGRWLFDGLLVEAEAVRRKENDAA